MTRFIALLGGLLLSAVTLAGEATLNWTNAPGIAGSQIAIGSCLSGFYDRDVVGADGKAHYTRIGPAVEQAVVASLEQGETFCFRIRHIAPSGTVGEWVFLGSKKIPLDSQQQPPILPPPGKPIAGPVT